MREKISQLFDLSGRVALCTGGNSGIGKRIGQALSEAGAAVVLVGRNQSELEQAGNDIFAISGNEVSVVKSDLQDRTQLESIVDKATDAFGPPDILINAAGINLRENYTDISDESWDQTLNLNLSIPFFLARQCIPKMQQIGRGNIINIASLQSYRAFANSMAYGASKGGIAQLTRAMAEAWSSSGVVCNAIAPGFFPTKLTKKVYQNPDLLAHNARMTAIGRNGELEDLDGIAIFLASSAAKYITGQVIAVDGGFTAK